MEKGTDEINSGGLEVNIPELEKKNSLNNFNSEETVSMEDKNINDGLFEDESYTAPVEVFAEFLSTLMSRNYDSALYYCKLILLYEPDNEVAQDFYPLIQEKIHMYNNESANWRDDEENESSQSESSTEYFSSTSVGSENMSSSNYSEDSSG